MKNNFAEILYDLKNYVEAYEQYMGVVKMDPKGKYSIDCATNAIIAANKMIAEEKREGKIKSRKSRTDIEPIELSEWETKKMQALDNLEQHTQTIEMPLSTSQNPQTCSSKRTVWMKPLSASDRLSLSIQNQSKRKERQSKLQKP